MKKTIITEGELISRARGLREYLNVLEAKFDPNVQALQDKLKKAGAKNTTGRNIGQPLTADGFMGPNTQAAMKAYPTVTTQTDAEKAAAGGPGGGMVATPADVAAAAQPAPQMTAADQDDADMGAAMAANAQAAKETEIGANQDAEDAAMGAAMTANAAAAAAPAPAAPAAPAAWTPTPEQAKWLGGADQQDPYILSRMPGVKPPVTHFKDPADQAKAKQMKFPAAPAPAAPAAAAPAPAAPTNPFASAGRTPAAPAAAPAPVAEASVSYRDDQALARIVDLARR
jgi:hypothetical protein